MATVKRYDGTGVRSMLPHNLLHSSQEKPRQYLRYCRRVLPYLTSVHSEHVCTENCCIARHKVAEFGVELLLLRHPVPLSSEYKPRIAVC